MNHEKIEKELRFLKIYAAAATLLCAIVFLTAFATKKNANFAELTVERINVVEKDGKLKMVISNQARQHPGAVDGTVWTDRIGKRAPGMIFFNDRGDEIGGLIFGGNAGEGQYGSLTFDKFRGDQTIQFIHNENKDGNYFSGLNVNDENLSIPDRLAKIDAIKKLPTKEAQDAAYKEMREKGEFLVNRLFIGRGRNKTSLIDLSDANGKTRIEISVAANGDPKINFLDETGKVVYSLPEDAKAKK